MNEAAKQRTTKTKAEAIPLVAPSRLPTALNLACRCSSLFPAIVLHSLSLTQQQHRVGYTLLTHHWPRYAMAARHAKAVVRKSVDGWEPPRA